MGEATDHGWLLVQRADAEPGDVERAERLRGLLGQDADLRRTEGPGDLDAAIDTLEGRVLVVCGGDGSIHLAANRLAALDRLGETRVALFPAGTGNDLGHTLHLPEDPEDMAALLRAGPTRDLDLLQVGDDVAVNALHAGIGVEAAARSQDLPDRLGALAYPLGAVLAGVAAEGFDGEVRVDDRVLRPAEGTSTLMVLVMNGRTIGGGHAFAPGARPDDGRLDVVVCRATGAAARAAFGVAVTRGVHLDRDDVAAARGRRATVTGPALTWNVDGELWLDRPVDELAVDVRPGALRLVAPRP